MKVSVKEIAKEDSPEYRQLVLEGLATLYQMFKRLDREWVEYLEAHAGLEVMREGREELGIDSN